MFFHLVVFNCFNTTIYLNYCISRTLQSFSSFKVIAHYTVSVPFLPLKSALLQHTIIAKCKSHRASLVPLKLLFSIVILSLKCCMQRVTNTLDTFKCFISDSLIFVGITQVRQTFQLQAWVDVYKHVQTDKLPFISTPYQYMYYNSFDIISKRLQL